MSHDVLGKDQTSVIQTCDCDNIHELAGAECGLAALSYSMWMHAMLLDLALP
eukprot:m.371407 g.371407  ORF g.371407 m.371407 type:complete len:52 (-) comp58491_c0_seq1:113-268(-)